MAKQITGTYLGQAQRKEKSKELSSESVNKEEGANKEVNQYLGWMIHSLLERLYRNELENDDDNESKKTINDFLVAGMQIFHHNAINGQSYLEKCYDDFDILRNKGWMTLVSPVYFDFGIKLLTIICSRFNQDKLKELGKSCIKIAREAVLGSDHLQSIFLECQNETLLSSKRKKCVYQQLVEKTINAQIGQE
jgi:hypothetical protein